MPLSSALYSGVTGLDAISTAISVVGDNIANVNTAGFKARRAEFADVLGQTLTSAGGASQIGAGATIQRVLTVYAQGTFETTNRPTDLAIEGRGFFVLDGTQGRFYSRAGIFNFDENGLLIDPTGQRVQGYGIDPITGVSNGVLGDIVLNTAVSPPRATTLVDMSVNLNSGIVTLVGPFDPSNPQGTSDFQTVLTVFDSLGNARDVTVYYTQNAAGSWDWTVGVPPAQTTTPPASPGDPIVVMGSGTLTFDTSGALTAVGGGAVTFDFVDGAAPGQVINFGFGPVAGVGAGAPTTQFGASSATNSFNQDGFGAGLLQSLSVDQDGFLTGQFSSGTVLPLAQVALANFANLEGLQAVGNNHLRASLQSGQALLGAARTGSFGSIRSSALEQSTVDLAAEFVKLIVHQRAYQANTRTISTTNELLAALVNLGQ